MTKTCLSVLLIGSVATLGAQEKQTAAEKLKVPAEQYYKNVQVLKGGSAEQLDFAMRFIATSLGVGCEHCHVTREHGAWPMEKDDKPTKRTARQMIAMMREINSRNFQGELKVTCVTCHRRQPKPVAVPQFAQVGQAATPSAPSTPQEKVTAEQVVKKYSEALGGEARLEKLRSRVLKGTLTTASGRVYPLEIRNKVPNKVLVIITLPDGKQTVSGYNGSVAWVQAPDGAFPLSGFELAQVQRRAEFPRDLQLASRYTLKMEPSEIVGERPAQVLSAEGKDNVSEKLFFDAQSGALLRRIVLTHTLLGDLPEQAEYEDYRQVGEVKVPFTLHEWEQNRSRTLKFTEVKDDVALDDSQFDPPPFPQQR